MFQREADMGSVSDSSGPIPGLSTIQYCHHLISDSVTHGLSYVFLMGWFLAFETRVCFPYKAFGGQTNQTTVHHAKGES